MVSTVLYCHSCLQIWSRLCESGKTYLLRKARSRKNSLRPSFVLIDLSEAQIGPTVLVCQVPLRSGATRSLSPSKGVLILPSPSGCRLLDQFFCLLTSKQVGSISMGRARLV